MSLDEALALIWFVCSIGAFLFALSAIVNHFKGRVAKEDWKKSLFFFVLSAIFLSLFSMTMDAEASGIEHNTPHQSCSHRVRTQ